MMILADDIPATVIPTNVYMLLYLMFALAIGPAGLALFKAVQDWRKDKDLGRKDHIEEMEEWNNDIVRERNFYHDQSVWRGELIGRLEYEINTNPHFGPEVVHKIRQTMPPEPTWGGPHHERPKSR